MFGYILAILPNPFDLEAWSFAATIWGGFGTLAVIPLIQLFRHRRAENIQTKKTMHERLDDLCERLGIVEKHVETHSIKIERLDEKVGTLKTDVRVLEAVTERDAELERQKGHNRKEDDYNQENG